MSPKLAKRMAPYLRPSGATAERGATAVLAAIVMAGLLSATAVTVDYGLASVVRRQTQNAADATARAIAVRCAKGLPNCTTLIADDSAIIEGNASSAAIDDVSQPTLTRVKVTVRKTVNYELAGLLGKTSDVVRSSATAEWSSKHPTEGFPVLPLGVGYCTYKNKSGFAGTASETSYKINLRTDTLQSLRTILSPLTGTTSQVLALDWLLNMLGTSGSDGCTDVDGTQLLNFQGAVWLTGETVVTGLLSGQFGWNAGNCSLNVGNDLVTFVGGVEGAAFFPSGCAAKFGPGRPVAVGKVILLPIYKPQSTLQNKYGFKVNACVGLGHKAGTPTTCAEVPPKIGVKVVGYAPFMVTGWTFPSTPSATDTSVGCPAASLSTINLRSLVNGTMTVLDMLTGAVTSLLNSLLGVNLPTTSLACNGLQGYFTKSFTKDPNFQYGTGGADFGAGVVQIVE